MINIIFIIFYHLQKKIYLKKKNEKRKTKVNIIDNNEEEKTNNDELLLIKEMGSQASSTTTSLSKNYLISYYKGIKKIKNDEDIMPKFNFAKYILLFSIICFFIFIIIQSIYIIIYYNDESEKNNYYLLLKEYSENFNILFFSILSLICLAESIDSYSCKNRVNEIANNLNYLNINNSINYNQSIDFANLTELLLIQNEIRIQNLETNLNIINKYLALYNEKDFTYNIKLNLSSYKINQIFKNNELNLSLTKEKLIFSDFIKLMASRFKIILKDCNYITSPIYILNKTGNETFNNVLFRQRLDSSQENIYLIILDYRIFSQHFDTITSEISQSIFKMKEKFKYITYLFLNLNVLCIIVIIISLFLYIRIYIIIKLINNINIIMRQKRGDITVKDILRKKIDNIINIIIIQ